MRQQTFQHAAGFSPLRFHSDADVACRTVSIVFYEMKSHFGS